MGHWPVFRVVNYKAVDDVEVQLKKVREARICLLKRRTKNEPRLAVPSVTVGDNC